MEMSLSSLKFLNHIDWTTDLEEKETIMNYLKRSDCSIQSIRFFNFEDEKDKGKLMECLLVNTSLNKFDFDECFDDSILKIISSKLNVAVCLWHEITFEDEDIIPSYFANYSNNTYLDIITDFRVMTEQIMMFSEWIREAKHLRNLEITDSLCSLNDEKKSRIIVSILENTNIESISLRDNDLTSVDPFVRSDRLRNHPKLRYLDLRNNGFTWKQIDLLENTLPEGCKLRMTCYSRDCSDDFSYRFIDSSIEKLKNETWVIPRALHVLSYVSVKNRNRCFVNNIIKLNIKWFGVEPDRVLYKTPCLRLFHMENLTRFKFTVSCSHPESENEEQRVSDIDNFNKNLKDIANMINEKKHNKLKSVFFSCPSFYYQPSLMNALCLPPLFSLQDLEIKVMNENIFYRLMNLMMMMVNVGYECTIKKLTIELMNTRFIDMKNNVILVATMLRRNRTLKSFTWLRCGMNGNLFILFFTLLKGSACILNELTLNYVYTISSFSETCMLILLEFLKENRSLFYLRINLDRSRKENETETAAKIEQCLSDLIKNNIWLESCEMLESCALIHSIEIEEKLNLLCNRNKDIRDKTESFVHNWLLAGKDYKEESANIDPHDIRIFFSYLKYIVDNNIFDKLNIVNGCDKNNVKYKLQRYLLTHYYDDLKDFKLPLEIKLKIMSFL